MCCATVCTDHAPAQGATYPFPDAVQLGHLTKLHLGIHALGRHYANAHRPCLTVTVTERGGVGAGREPVRPPRARSESSD